MNGFVEYLKWFFDPNYRTKRLQKLKSLRDKNKTYGVNNDARQSNKNN